MNNHNDENLPPPSQVVLANGRVLEVRDEPPAGLSPTENPEAQISAILHVRTPGYVPAGVDLRTRLTPQMFTANLTAGDLERLRRDPEIACVDAARPLPLVYR